MKCYIYYEINLKLQFAEGQMDFMESTTESVRIRDDGDKEACDVGSKRER